ncbi:MAG: hypothetical protein Fur0037_28340 [Planctomycetota bacterium]
MKTLVCQSDEVDARAAASDLLAQAENGLCGERPKAGLLFASTDYDHAVLLEGIAGAWPGMPLIGGTGDGEMASTQGFQHDSAVLTLFADDLRAAAGHAPDVGADPARAVARAMEPLRGMKPGLCIAMFAPTANGSAVVRETRARLGAGCGPVVGGMTGDHAEYRSMVEFFGAKASRDSLSILALEGDFRVGTGLGAGWFPIGDPRVVTESAGHIVRTINERPALEIFRDYWRAVPEGDGLGEYPLAVYPDGPCGDFYLRAVLGSDPRDGSIRLAGEAPTGALVRLTEVLPEGVLAGSSASAKSARASCAAANPALALVFSCAARKWVLGTKAEREFALMREEFRRSDIDPAIAGLYVFGEVGPASPTSASRFHNETCVTVLLGS